MAGGAWALPIVVSPTPLAPGRKSSGATFSVSKNGAVRHPPSAASSGSGLQDLRLLEVAPGRAYGVVAVVVAH
jgi:hypothetical protein